MEASMGKIVIMARNPSGDGDPTWAQQFVRKDPSKRGWVSVSPASDWIALPTLMRGAAALAGLDGTVAFLGGHGRACKPTDAMCNTNPQMNFSIELCTPNIVLEQDILFYKTKTPPNMSLEEVDNSTIANANTDPSQRSAADLARKRQSRRQAYEAIGTALNNSQVRWVLILACRCSIGMPLIKQLAADWGVVVGVYTLRLAIGPVGSRIRLFFEGDSPGAGSNTADAETELPDFSEPHGIAVHPDGSMQTFVM
jgi:hypothetical protein